MKRRLPRVTGRDVLSALRRAGFEEIRVRGSHHYLRRPGGGKLVTVPVHAGETIGPKLLRCILEQAGLTEEEFFELL